MVYTFYMKTYYDEVLEGIVKGDAIRATKFIGPKNIIRASRRLSGGRIPKGNIEIILTIGKPNYAEREFIKICEKVKEPFPIRKIQLKFCRPKKNIVKRK